MPRDAVWKQKSDDVFGPPATDFFVSYGSVAFPGSGGGLSFTGTGTGWSETVTSAGGFFTIKTVSMPAGKWFLIANITIVMGSSPQPFGIEWTNISPTPTSSKFSDQLAVDATGKVTNECVPVTVCLYIDCSATGTTTANLTLEGGGGVSLPANAVAKYKDGDHIRVGVAG